MIQSNARPTWGKKTVAMIPSEAHPIWGKLVKGEIDYKFRLTSAGMLFFSLRLDYKKNPSSLNEFVRMARTFFVKYQSILVDDMQKLFN